MSDPSGVKELFLMFFFIIVIAVVFLGVVGGGSALTLRFLVSRLTGDRYVSESQLNIITCVFCIVVMYVAYRLFVVKR